MKLTKLQTQLLTEIAENTRRISTSNGSAKRLVDLGLAEWKGRFTGSLLTITDAGRAALRETSRDA